MRGNVRHHRKIRSRAERMVARLLERRLGQPQQYRDFPAVFRAYGSLSHHENEKTASVLLYGVFPVFLPLHDAFERRHTVRNDCARVRHCVFHL